VLAIDTEDVLARGSRSDAPRGPQPDQDTVSTVSWCLR
jgi:hypothetical protein